MVEILERSPASVTALALHMQRTRLRRRLAGIALVLVLWVVALLSTMALTLIATQRTESSLTRNLISIGQGRALAEAGIYYAIARGLLYRTSTKSERWQPDGILHDWEFAGSQLGLAIISEHAFIDLNKAGAELLDGLLEASGVSESEVPALRDAILDWRDKGDDRRLQGAEDDDYQSAGRAVGARDDAFASVSELRQVLGMTPEIYQAMAPALTVYSGRATVNARFAPALVLSALPGMDADRVDEYLALRLSDRERGLEPPQPAGVNNKLLDRGKGRVFRVHAEAPVADGGMVRVEVRVRTVSGSVGYQILSWNYHPDPLPVTQPPEVAEEEAENPSG